MPTVVTRQRIHLGPSLHAQGPCATVRVAWGDVAAASERIVADVAGALRRAGVGADEAEGAARSAAAAPGRAAADAAVALQRALGHSVPEAPAAPSDDAVVAPLWDADIGAAAARAAIALIGIARGDGPPGADGDAQAAADRYRARVRGLEHSDCVMRILPAAERRDIPWARLVPTSPMIRLGQGARQKRIDGSSTPGVSALARAVSTHKDLAAALMRRHGLPVPENRRVARVEDAVRAAGEIGYPVVVKPNSTDLGVGITLDVRDEAALRRAYPIAARHGRVLIERQLDGYNTRLMVMFGRFVSAVRKNPAQVVGDGRRTARALIEAENAARGGALKPIEIDEEAHRFLAQQGLSIDAVPAAGQAVVLRHVSNFARGGSAHNVTPIVHPDNARLAEQAAAVVGLEVCGVDLIMPDIARSWREVGGGICELNSGPGIYMAEPDTRIEDAMIAGLFPDGATGRVPIVCLLADDDARAADMVAAIERRLGGRGVGVATPAGARVDDWALSPRPMRPHDATQIILADPRTRAAVIHLPPRAAAEDGLGFDRCDLAIMRGDATSPAARLVADHAARVAPVEAPRLDDAIDRLAGAMPTP